MVNVTIGTGVGAGIILGCGVMHQEQLYPLVRKKTPDYLGGYITVPELADIDSYIVAPSLNDNQGAMGALELGRRALLGE